MIDEATRRRTCARELEPVRDREGRPEFIIVMGVGAISGLVIGLLARGEFISAIAIFAAAGFSGWIGWWLRGAV